MFLIGVTGGIGSGKTSVLKIVSELGFPVVDADDLVHELYAPGKPVFQAVIGRWGETVRDSSGNVDRAAVAKIVFSDDEQLNWLNGIVHPLVRKRIREMGRLAGRPLFCGIPLLFETGWQDDVDLVVSVWCSEKQQEERLLARGWSREDAKKRIAKQMDMTEKLQKADIGIVNNGSLDQLREQCRRICEKTELNFK